MANSLSLGETFKNRFAKAIHENDLCRIATLVDFLRFELRMNYQAVAELACKISGLDEGSWEQLLYEVDEHEA